MIFTIKKIYTMKNILNIPLQKFSFGKLWALCCCFCLFSCSGFLDIVPDNVLQYEDFFVSRNQAYHVLAQISSYRSIDNRDYSNFLLGDEYSGLSGNLPNRLMRGITSPSVPVWDFWTGYNQENYSRAIRHCDLFIENIDLVPDMTSEDKADWKAQGKVQKAYYLYEILRCHGPVILPKLVSPDSPKEDIFLPRSKVEDCFDYIIALMDEAIPDLKERAGVKDLGQIDKCAAKALKARILLQRASPFYNGNKEYYGNFLDHDGQPFFSLSYDREKWKSVIDAVDDALATCAKNGLGLYTYTGKIYDYDTEDYLLNPVKMKTLYDLRMLIVDSWNKEIIWGGTGGYINNPSTCMHLAAVIQKPAGYGGPGSVNSGGSTVRASFQSMERFYTEHGLPTEEDITFPVNTMREVVTTPDETDPEYQALRGIMQPGVSTVRMYLNREPRFYANLGITGGYYRAHQVRIRTMMFAGADGGYSQSTTETTSTGISVQKIVHPETIYNGSATSGWVWFATPYIRVAELYLMRAEALNEYNGPSQEVYDAINAIRLRAGIPTVEESYGNPEWASDQALNKHLTQEGMREIILRERSIEFAYEGGIFFWDMMRTKRAVSTFSNPIWGWNWEGRTPGEFFVKTLVEPRIWSVTQCLWPVRLAEMNSNVNLIQNPGW
jgi:hypothetical protein